MSAAARSAHKAASAAATACMDAAIAAASPKGVIKSSVSFDTTSGYVSLLGDALPKTGKVAVYGAGELGKQSGDFDAAHATPLRFLPRQSSGADGTAIVAAVKTEQGARQWNRHHKNWP